MRTASSLAKPAAPLQPALAEPKTHYAIGTIYQGPAVFHHVASPADTGQVVVEDTKIITLSRIPDLLRRRFNLSEQETGTFRAAGDHGPSSITIKDKMYLLDDFADIGVRMMLGVAEVRIVGSKDNT